MGKVSVAITTECREIVKAGWDYRKDIPVRYWEVVERYRDELLDQASGILGNRDDAEDAVQETFIEVFRDPAKISQDSIGASLKLINRCNALDRLRSRKRTEKQSKRKDLAVKTRAFTTGPFRRIDSRESLVAALSKLPRHLQEVVELRYFHHYAYKDIAARLKLPIGAVGPMLSEASILLFDLLSDKPRNNPNETE